MTVCPRIRAPLHEATDPFLHPATGIPSLLAKQAELKRIANLHAAEAANTVGELDRFEQRLDGWLSARPRMATSSRRGSMQGPCSSST